MSLDFDTNVLQSGVIKKLGGFNKRIWQERYCMICSDTINFFPKHDVKKLRKQILLCNYNISDSSSYGLECIQLNAIDGSETVFLGYESCFARDSWLHMLQYAKFSSIGGGFFGSSLLTLSKSKLCWALNGCVIRLVNDCIDILSDPYRSLSTEGLFRKNGNLADVKFLKESYQIGKSPNLSRDDICVLSVASLLKLYLAALPEPVVPYDIFPAICTAGLKIRMGDAKSETENLIHLITSLPIPQRNLFKSIIEFLHHVTKYEYINKMNANSLARIFCPHILADDNDRLLVNMELALSSDQRNLSIETLTFIIENSDKLFFSIPFVNIFTQAEVSITKLSRTSFLFDEPTLMGSLTTVLNRKLSAPEHSRPKLTAADFNRYISASCPISSSSALQTAVNLPCIPSGMPNFGLQNSYIVSLAKMLKQKQAENLQLSRECFQFMKKQVKPMPLLYDLIDFGDHAESTASCSNCQEIKSENENLKLIINRLNNKIDEQKREMDLLINMLTAFNTSFAI